MGCDFPDMLSNMFNTFELAGKDEEGAHNVTVNEDISWENVLKKVLDVVSQNLKS